MISSVRLTVLKHILGDKSLPLEIELVRVYLQDGRVFRLPPQRMAYPGGDPSRVAESAQTQALLVHGTSWRYDDAQTQDFDDDTLVVTYVAVLPEGRGGTAVKNYSTFPKSARTPDSVAAHAVEHLALLASRNSISLPESWMDALEGYTPFPAMEKHKSKDPNHQPSDHDPRKKKASPVRGENKLLKTAIVKAAWPYTNTYEAEIRELNNFDLMPPGKHSVAFGVKDGQTVFAERDLLMHADMLREIGKDEDDYVHLTIRNKVGERPSVEVWALQAGVPDIDSIHSPGFETAQRNVYKSLEALRRAGFPPNTRTVIHMPDDFGKQPWIDTNLEKHKGPGPHPDGTSQSVHGRRSNTVLMTIPVREYSDTSINSNKFTTRNVEIIELNEFSDLSPGQYTVAVRIGDGRAICAPRADLLHTEMLDRIGEKDDEYVHLMVNKKKNTRISVYVAQAGVPDAYTMSNEESVDRALRNIYHSFDKLLEIGVPEKSFVSILMPQDSKTRNLEMTLKKHNSAIAGEDRPYDSTSAEFERSKFGQTQDHCVRLWNSIDPSGRRGMISTDVREAGEEIDYNEHDESNPAYQRAMKKIYRAFDALNKLGLPEHTQTQIRGLKRRRDSVSQKIISTLKSL